ncbi:protein mono-ADP-ribosyltransferase PARP11 isoform X1 [Bufo bufo]|uniref:protein mono-ADP-ribosyltransferase PARP11 isoform X1 n=2 Tax=Bufo bufo TaxID=8384 RepID=UPI001ABEBACE|nr:protein mono-ADP-ribosyltransferase PARP11 isoform X1 [Bufo bufo]XP_040295233.1 protein mono-ADP-ribosyltransferase PARP11 isoform X1 [Bufo bufo]
MVECCRPTHKMGATIDIDVTEDMDVSETQWGWFYLAECGKWHMFETTSTAYCSISSQEIEQHYKANPHASVNFRTMKFNYTLDFIGMKQTNLCTGKQRPVKRAPFSISAFSYICDNGSIPMPSHWEHVNNSEPYQLIPLIKCCNEYNEVANLFGDSMDKNRIANILRIQNLDLWEFYCRKKAQLKKKKGLSQIAEEMLFHGTSNEFVNAICIHNFDWRINGIHGAVYGKGTYFAKNASLSSQYCKNTGKHGPTLKLHGVTSDCFQFFSKKSMFLARVVVGEHATGDSKYIRPPSKDGSLTNLYDSCVDNPFSPLIYVIFDSNQIYPEYLIHFD